MIRGFRKLGALLALCVALSSAETAIAEPTLKGPLRGTLQLDPDAGLIIFTGGGHLTLMGKVDMYGEFVFAPGEATDSLDGVGVAAVIAADGDVLVSNVKWTIDADGNGDLEFRWPGAVTFSDSTTIESTGRFTKLPFGGLRATSTLSPSVDWGDGSAVPTSIKMTGEIVDPDPLDT